MSYSVAVIGAGPDPDNTVSGESFSMGYRHAWAFEDHDDCEIVAVADVVLENAEAFADEFDIDDDAVFEDHAEMLEELDLDIVSIAVPPAFHAELTIDCAKAGVEAVHCEKPMADTWAKSVRMAQECWRRDVQLTFNHQLRYHDVTQKAKELLDEGAIGDLERIEMSRKTLFDSGSHQIDLANYFNDDVSVSWVLGALDYREENLKFGVHNTNQALSQWQYDNGVYGLAATGDGADFVGHSHRLLGSDGTIELDFFDPEPHVTVETTDGVEKYEYEGHNPIDRAVVDLVDCLESGDEPLVGAKTVLTTNELIFGTYESVRERQRVELPLEIEDNPLEALVEAGEVGPEAE